MSYFPGCLSFLSLLLLAQHLFCLFQTSQGCCSRDKRRFGFSPWNKEGGGLLRDEKRRRRKQLGTSKKHILLFAPQKQEKTSSFPLARNRCINYCTRSRMEHEKGWEVPLFSLCGRSYLSQGGNEVDAALEKKEEKSLTLFPSLSLSFLWWWRDKIEEVQIASFLQRLLFHSPVSFSFPFSPHTQKFLHRFQCRKSLG